MGDQPEPSGRQPLSMIPPKCSASSNPLARSRSNFPRSAPIWKNIAAALAEAQKAGTQRIGLLEDELQGLDNVIDAAEHDLQYGHPNHVGGQATTGHTHSAPGG
ncbi:hypothetical protein ACFU7Q_07120 [Mycobacterium avium subsp. paratuberculosis]|uniref:putative alpha/beta hydrolase n=1 Tax=Mycobacterium avium TaxID=1764 RepID=UPI00355BAA6C